MQRMYEQAQLASTTKQQTVAYELVGNELASFFPTQLCLIIAYLGFFLFDGVQKCLGHFLA